MSTLIADQFSLEDWSNYLALSPPHNGEFLFRLIWELEPMEVVSRWHAVGGDLDLVGPYDQTLLMKAAVVADSDLPLTFLQWLIDHGANVHQTNEKEETALTLACKQGAHAKGMALFRAGARADLEALCAQNWVYGAHYYCILLESQPDVKFDMPDPLAKGYRLLQLANEHKLKGW